MDSDVEKWFENAEDDFEVAEDNFSIGNQDVSMFFCHQAAEKALKAFQIQKEGEKSLSHNLVSLANQLDISEHEELLAELNPFYVGFRYPDEESPEVENPEDILKRTGEFLEWTRKKLKK